MVVADAIETLSTLDALEVIDRIADLRNYDSPYVVGSVLRFLSRHSPSRARPLLLEALSSDQSIIRQNAVDELDELMDVAALPHLRRLLNDEDKAVRQAAHTAVTNPEEHAREQ